MKKKLIASLIAASMLLTLSACGGKDSGTPASATDSEQTSSTAHTDAPDGTVTDNANKATQDGVYLYNGTFLATGETVKISDSGAAIDMPSVTVYSADAKLQSDGTYDIRDDGHTLVMDGSSIFSSKDTNKMRTAPHAYGSISSPGLHANRIYNNTDEEAANGIGVYMELPFSDGLPGNDPSRTKDSIAINREQPFSLEVGRTLESLMDTYGEPAGAYCKQNPNYDRPENLCYIWKSGNYPDKTLIMAYEIQYSWSGESDNHATVEEHGGDDVRYRLLSFFVADDVKNWAEPDGNSLPLHLLPALSELGLYTE